MYSSECKVRIVWIRWKFQPIWQITNYSKCWNHQKMWFCCWKGEMSLLRFDHLLEGLSQQKNWHSSSQGRNSSDMPRRFEGHGSCSRYWELFYKTEAVVLLVPKGIASNINSYSVCTNWAPDRGVFCANESGWVPLTLFDSNPEEHVGFHL